MENEIKEESAPEKEEATTETEKKEVLPEEKKDIAEEDKKAPAADPEAKPEETPEAIPEEKKAADALDGTYSEEQKAEPIENAYFRPISYENDGSRTIDEDVERLRKIFQGKLKGPHIADIMTMVVLFLGVGAVILVWSLKAPTWAFYTTLGIVFAVFIASFVVSNIFNKKRTKVMGEYLCQYEDTTMGYALAGLNITDLSLAPEGKIEDSKIVEAHYFSTINSIDSRALVAGKRNGLDFQSAEVAVSIPSRTFVEANKKPEDFLRTDGTKYVPSPISATVSQTQDIQTKDMTMIDLDVAAEVGSAKNSTEKRAKDEAKAQKNAPTRTSSGLFGKYFAYGYTVSSQESIIIVFMGDKENTVVPDYVNSYQPIHVSGLRSNILVYAADISYSGAFFTADTIKILNGFEPDSTINSGFLSLNSYGTKIALNAGDNLMSLPMKQLNHIGVYDSFRRSLESCFAFVDAVAEIRKK